MVGTRIADLAPVHHREERRAHRNLGLAETGVAANQAIHRLGAAHIADHLVDGGLLIGRLLELEALGEILVVAPRMRERVTLHHFARRVDIEQLARHREHLRLGAALDLLPCAAAELVELGLLVVRAADVALDEVDALDRHVHGVVGGILEV